MAILLCLRDEGRTDAIGLTLDSGVSENYLAILRLGDSLGSPGSTFVWSSGEGLGFKIMQAAVLTRSISSALILGVSNEYSIARMVAACKYLFFMVMNVAPSRMFNGQGQNLDP